MTPLYSDRNGQLAILGKIAKDYIPSFGSKDIGAMLAASNVTSDECLTFLKERSQFYKKVSQSQQTFQPRTREIHAIIRTTYVNNAITRPLRTSGDPASTQTSSYQPSQSRDRTNQQPAALPTEGGSRSVVTRNNAPKSAKRKEIVSPPEPPAKRRAQAPPVVALLSTAEFIVGIEDDVIAVAESLQNVSSSEKLANLSPDVVSIAFGEPESENVSVITVYLKEKNIKSVTETMVFCQNSVVRSEAIAGNLRINTAIWKLMYIDWYGLVER